MISFIIGILFVVLCGSVVEGNTGCPCASSCGGSPVYHASRGICYKLVSAPDFTWSDALLQCSRDGGRLAQPKTEERLQYLWRTLSHDFPYVWVGGFFNSTTQQWLWEDGEQLSHSIAPGVPDTSGLGAMTEAEKIALFGKSDRLFCTFLTEQRGSGTGELLSWQCAPPSMAFLCEKEQIFFETTGPINVSYPQAQGSGANHANLKIKIAGSGLSNTVLLRHIRVTPGSESPCTGAGVPQFTTPISLLSFLSPLQGEGSDSNPFFYEIGVGSGSTALVEGEYALCYYGHYQFYGEGMVEAAKKEGEALSLSDSGVRFVVAGRPVVEQFLVTQFPEVYSPLMSLPEDSFSHDLTSILRPLHFGGVWSTPSPYEDSGFPYKVEVKGANLAPGMFIMIGCDRMNTLVFPLRFEGREVKVSATDRAFFLIDSATVDVSRMQGVFTSETQICIAPWGYDDSSTKQPNLQGPSIHPAYSTYDVLWDAKGVSAQTAFTASIPSSAILENSGVSVKIVPFPVFDTPDPVFFTYFELISEVGLTVNVSGQNLGVNTVVFSFCGSEACSGAALFTGVLQRYQNSERYYIEIPGAGKQGASRDSFEQNAVFFVCYAAVRTADTTGYHLHFSGVKARVNPKPLFDAQGPDKVLFSRSSNNVSVSLTARYLHGAEERPTGFYTMYAGLSEEMGITTTTCSEEKLFTSLAGLEAALVLPERGTFEVQSAATSAVGAEFVMPPPQRLRFPEVSGAAVPQSFCLLVLAANTTFETASEVGAFLRSVPDVWRFVISSRVRIEILPTPVFSTADAKYLQTGASEVGLIEMSASNLSPPIGLSFAAFVVNGAERCGSFSPTSARLASVVPIDQNAVDSGSLSFRNTAFFDVLRSLGGDVASSATLRLCWTHHGSTTWEDTNLDVTIVPPATITPCPNSGPHTTSLNLNELDSEARITLCGTYLSGGLEFSVEGDGGGVVASLGVSFDCGSGITHCSSGVLRITPPEGQSDFRSVFAGVGAHRIVWRGGGQVGDAQIPLISLNVVKAAVVNRFDGVAVQYSSLVECGEGTKSLSFAVSGEFEASLMRFSIEGTTLSGEDATLRAIVGSSGGGLFEGSLSILPAACRVLAEGLLGQYNAFVLGGNVELNSRFSVSWQYTQQIVSLTGNSIVQEDSGKVSPSVVVDTIDTVGFPVFALAVQGNGHYEVSLGLLEFSGKGSVAVSLPEAKNVQQELIGEVCTDMACGGCTSSELRAKQNDVVLSLEYSVFETHPGRTLFLCWRFAEISGAHRAGVSITLPRRPYFDVSTPLPSPRVAGLGDAPFGLPGIYPDTVVAGEIEMFVVLSTEEGCPADSRASYVGAPAKVNVSNEFSASVDGSTFFDTHNAAVVGVQHRLCYWIAQKGVEHSITSGLSKYHISTTGLQLIIRPDPIFVDTKSSSFSLIELMNLPDVSFELQGGNLADDVTAKLVEMDGGGGEDCNDATNHAATQTMVSATQARFTHSLIPNIASLTIRPTPVSRYTGGTYRVCWGLHTTTTTWKGFIPSVTITLESPPSFIEGGMIELMGSSVLHMPENGVNEIALVDTVLEEEKDVSLYFTESRVCDLGVNGKEESLGVSLGGDDVVYSLYGASVKGGVLQLDAKMAESVYFAQSTAQRSSAKGTLFHIDMTVCWSPYETLNFTEKDAKFSAVPTNWAAWTPTVLRVPKAPEFFLKRISVRGVEVTSLGFAEVLNGGVAVVAVTAVFPPLFDGLGGSSPRAVTLTKLIAFWTRLGVAQQNEPNNHAFPDSFRIDISNALQSVVQKVSKSENFASFQIDSSTQTSSNEDGVVTVEYSMTVPLEALEGFMLGSANELPIFWGASLTGDWTEGRNGRGVARIGIATDVQTGVSISKTEVIPNPAGNALHQKVRLTFIISNLAVGLAAHYAVSPSTETDPEKIADLPTAAIMISICDATLFEGVGQERMLSKSTSFATLLTAGADHEFTVDSVTKGGDTPHREDVTIVVTGIIPKKSNAPIAVVSFLAGGGGEETAKVLEVLPFAPFASTPLKDCEDGGQIERTIATQKACFEALGGCCNEGGCGVCTTAYASCLKNGEKVVGCSVEKLGGNGATEVLRATFNLAQENFNAVLFNAVVSDAVGGFAPFIDIISVSPGSTVVDFTMQYPALLSNSSPQLNTLQQNERFNTVQYPLLSLSHLYNVTAAPIDANTLTPLVFQPPASDDGVDTTRIILIVVLGAAILLGVLCFVVRMAGAGCCWEKGGRLKREKAVPTENPDSSTVADPENVAEPLPDVSAISGAQAGDNTYSTVSLSDANLYGSVSPEMARQEGSAQAPLPPQRWPPQRDNQAPKSILSVTRPRSVSVNLASTSGSLPVSLPKEKKERGGSVFTSIASPFEVEMEEKGGHEKRSRGGSVRSRSGSVATVAKGEKGPGTGRAPNLQNSQNSHSQLPGVKALHSSRPSTTIRSISSQDTCVTGTEAKTDKPNLVPQVIVPTTNATDSGIFNPRLDNSVVSLGSGPVHSVSSGYTGGAPGNVVVAGPSPVHWYRQGGGSGQKESAVLTPPVLEVRGGGVNGGASASAAGPAPCRECGHPWQGGQYCAYCGSQAGERPYFPTPLVPP